VAQLEVPSAASAVPAGRVCDQARFTGYQIDGGFAEFAVADQRFCFALPAAYSDAGADQWNLCGTDAENRSGRSS
jgi:NADPH:quinone reductase-like Zn-dependent oxidoreductase